MWYGAWRTKLGEVPLLDFQSYDPGRYYYLALMSRIFGDGIVGTRESLIVLQWIAISIGLLILRRAGASWSQVSLCGMSLAWWMWPDFKLVDSAFAALTVAAGVSLAKSPTRISCFATGAYAGIAAIFGRNHGVYAVVGFGAILLFLWWKESRPIHPGSFAAGIVLGYSPMLFAMVGIRGFLPAVLASIQVNVASGTNVPLPIPWPWRLPYAGLTWQASANQFFTGICYVLVYAGCGAALLYLIGSKWRGTDRQKFLLAAAVTSLAYLHQASVRADLGHLAEASPPSLLLLAGVLAPVKATWRVMAWIGVGVISWFSIGQVHALVQKIQSPEQWVLRTIDRDSIWVDRPNAAVLDAVLAFDRARNPSGGPVFLAPNLPTMYRVLCRKSPTWEIYFVLPATPAANAVSIRELASSGARYLILGDIPLDHRDDLRFRNTHPQLYDYIRLHYEEMPEATMPGSYKAYEIR
jgi:hypothetical protein